MNDLWWARKWGQLIGVIIVLVFIGCVVLAVKSVR